ncbi:hypothetical protein D9M68_991790 [compost metagenome]
MPFSTFGSSVTSSLYQPVKKARTLSWMSALGACRLRCVDAAQTTGPVQSCGATGSCQASAMAAILRASVRPPHQLRSSIATPATPVCR